MQKKECWQPNTDKLHSYIALDVVMNITLKAYKGDWESH